MTVWVGLLRAVNVGGNAKLKMAELRDALVGEGLTDVETYIASGNLVFTSDYDATALTSGIDSLLNTRFNISGARTVMRELADLQDLVAGNPFREAAKLRPNMLHVHFLSGPAHPNAEINLTSYKGVELLRLHGQHLYIDYPNGVGESDLTLRFLEMALGASGTARNWNTVMKLRDLALAKKHNT